MMTACVFSRAVIICHTPTYTQVRGEWCCVRCRIADLRLKEVINIATGNRIGFVNDLSIDIEGGKLLALVVPGQYRFFGLFGREDDYILPWDCVKRIGDDIILVDVSGEYTREKWSRRL